MAELNSLPLSRQGIPMTANTSCFLHAAAIRFSASTSCSAVVPVAVSSKYPVTEHSGKTTTRTPSWLQRPMNSIDRRMLSCRSFVDRICTAAIFN